MIPIPIASLASLHPAIYLLVGAFFILIPLRFSSFRADIPIRRRLAHSEDSFVHHLMSLGFDPRIARTTYRYLRSRCKVRSPILISDMLICDLGLEPRTILEAIHALHVENGRSFPVGQVGISTVGSLVAIIQSSPRTDLAVAA